ncbi:IPP transferase-domain-containing protein [Phlyctochytrium arcticum]|nr:IPP transferase-domain-containing protein [Phlyctochytrium arcticum]
MWRRSWNQLAGALRINLQRPNWATKQASMDNQSKMVIAVVGTTGVGKSKLGVELAKALNGEVINADSMQVYKGLDIVTNKATESEREGIPHHLMSFVDPAHEYSVTDFHRDARASIAAIHARNRIPILVGGTNYYIQSLLWEDQIIDTDSIERTVPTTSSAEGASEGCEEMNDKIKLALDGTDPTKVTPEEAARFSLENDILGLLKEVDPVMGDKWHANDHRKIRRSLEVFFTTGKRHSAHFAEQRASSTHPNEKLRYKSIIFWLYSDPDALYPRLDARVDDMIQRGLFSELLAMRAKVCAGEVVGGHKAMQSIEPAYGMQKEAAESSDSDSESFSKTNYTRGILQAIGFKEFDKYLNGLESLTPNSGNEAIEGYRLEGIQEMKRATQQYARRQVTWIKNKLAPRTLQIMDLEREVEGRKKGAFYLLNATDLTQWTFEVCQPAIKLAADFSHNQTVDPRTLSESAQAMLQEAALKSSTEDVWRKYTCPVCVDPETDEKRVMNGAIEWEVHCGTKAHRRKMAELPTELGGEDTGRNTVRCA